MSWSVVTNPTIVVTAVVYGLLECVVVRAGLFGIWLGVLLAISLGRYSYVVLRATAQGRGNIPAVALETFNPVGEIMVLWHLVLFPGLILATAGWQPAGSIVAIVVAVVFPASAALMGLTSNLAHSLNPSALMGVAKTIGRDYVVLVVAYVGIFLGISVLLSSVAAQAFALPAIVGFALESWALLASFALIGSVVRTHRADFEIPGEIVPPEEERVEQRHRQWRKDLDRAYASMRSGLTQAGYETLHKLIEDNTDSLDINHWLIENLFDWEEKRFALEAAQRLMHKLIETGDTSGALELYRRCRHHDTAFHVSREAARALAEQAAAFGQQGLADEIMQQSLAVR